MALELDDRRCNKAIKMEGESTTAAKVPDQLQDELQGMTNAESNTKRSQIMVAVLLAEHYVRHEVKDYLQLNDSSHCANKCRTRFGCLDPPPLQKKNTIRLGAVMRVLQIRTIASRCNSAHI